MSFPEYFSYRYGDVDWTNHEAKTSENPVQKPEYDPSDVAFKNLGKEINMPKKKESKLACSPPFVRALVVDTTGGAVWTEGDLSQLSMCAEADLIVTKDGRVLKNRYGVCTVAFEHSQTDVIESVLSCLSGDLSHDNVAKAKEILKKLL